MKGEGRQALNTERERKGSFEYDRIPEHRDGTEFRIIIEDGKLCSGVIFNPIQTSIPSR